MKSLIQHIKNRIDITPMEEEAIISKFSKQVLAKKQSLLKAGEINHQLSYVNTGCLRVYSIDEEGLEKNVFFAVEDWWAIDVKSCIEQSPARFYIEAIEESELYQIPKADFDALLENIPKLEKWFRILLQNALIASENRIHYKAALNAEERYLKFIEKYPMLETRIPQKQIASYLGISPEFLSKLRADRWQRLKS